MTDPRQLELLHAEIDGELDPHQRAELARSLLADPALRGLREELHGMCRTLEQIPEAEPPPGLHERILSALPRAARRRGSSAPSWRFAALLAGVLTVGVLVLRLLDSSHSLNTEAVGTMARSPAPIRLDSVQLDEPALSGRVSLYRDRSEGLVLELNLHANAPVDVLVSGSGHSLRVNGLAGSGKPPDKAVRVPLRGFGSGAQRVDLSFLSAGAQVAAASLQVRDGS